MKLISLECNKPSFRSVHFNPEGLTVIVGDGSKDKKQEGSSNGVGKTLSLRLVHHCLGANSNPGLKAAVPDWVFRLSFKIGKLEHQVERSGDSKILLLDGDQIKISDLRRWLDQSGAFRLEPNLPRLSFRSLVKRFARYELGDCTDPLKTTSEPPFDSLLRSLYLLGIDCTLAVSKRNNKIESSRVNKSKNAWQEDKVLNELFRAGSEPKVRAEWLEREIPRLQKDIEDFQVAEDYRTIEKQADDLTQSLRQLKRDKAILHFQLQGIDKALCEQPDISRQDLLQLYKGLQTVFKPEALEHFKNVEAFHSSLAARRKERLEQDKLQYISNLHQMRENEHRIEAQRDALLQSLHGKRALDEYASLVQQLAVLKEESQRLHDYLNLSATLQEQAQKIKEQKVEGDRLTNEYLQQDPLQLMDAHFKEIVQKLYPRTPAGVLIENNDGDNQTRYNLKVHIEGQDSDGINAARILIFDWLLLMHGANHSMGFLWHDNRFFADIDPKQRFAWFRHLLNALPGTGKQYIATINTENYEAMQQYQSDDEKDAMDAASKLILRGDKPENKLLGIQFGSG